jgi:hypothetical protein
MTKKEKPIEAIIDVLMDNTDCGGDMIVSYDDMATLIVTAVEKVEDEQHNIQTL